jgi:ribosome-associated protein YbcJ (S4-like RNA binding protein)
LRKTAKIRAGQQVVFEGSAIRVSSQAEPAS